MSVVMTDPNQIAAAGAGQGTGDNTNAAAMASLANQTIVNGQTPINYYSNFVSTLGSTVSEVQTENTAQNASVTQLHSRTMSAATGPNTSISACSSAPSPERAEPRRANRAGRPGT